MPVGCLPLTLDHRALLSSPFLLASVSCLCLLYDACKPSLPLNSAPQRGESDWLPDTTLQASPQLGSSDGHLHVTIHRIFSVGGALGGTSTFVDPVIAGGKEESDCCPHEPSLRVNVEHSSY